MIARIRTSLPVSAPDAWPMLLQRDAFLYSTRGMLGFSGADSWPEFFAEGQVIKTRLVLFNLIPAWSYEIRVVRVDSSNRLDP